MKAYTFFPGFVVVTIIAVLLALEVIFKLDIPMIKNIKHPVFVMLGLGFMMCAFGTLGHAMVELFKTGINPFTVILIGAGLVILVFSVLRFGFKMQFLWIHTDMDMFFTLIGLIVFKIVISTIRVITLTESFM